MKKQGLPLQCCSLPCRFSNQIFVVAAGKGLSVMLSHRVYSVWFYVVILKNASLVTADNAELKCSYTI